MNTLQEPCCRISTIGRIPVWLDRRRNATCVRFTIPTRKTAREFSRTVRVILPWHIARDQRCANCHAASRRRWRHVRNGGKAVVLTASCDWVPATYLRTPGGVWEENRCLRPAGCSRALFRHDSATTTGPKLSFANSGTYARRGMCVHDPGRCTDCPQSSKHMAFRPSIPLVETSFPSFRMPANRIRAGIAEHAARDRAKHARTSCSIRYKRIVDAAESR